MDSTYILLQHYWWFLVSLLGALLVFLLFVQGGQSLLFTIGKTELQQKMLLNSTGRKWEFTFTTLVTFGGAFFASFPLFYSTSFGGAYWVWMLILACFVLQAVSYEYQSKKGNLLGKKTYQVFLLLNGILGPILLGTAVGTFFSGAEFVVNKGQLTDVAMPVISTWATPWHGLEAAFVFWNVCLGLAVFFLARIQALLYFINNIDDAEIVKRSRKHLVIETALFLVFFLVFLVHLLLADGFAVDPETKEVYMQPYKYFMNLVEMPAVSVVLLVGVAGVLYGIVRTILSDTWKKGIWFCGTGTVLTVLALLLCAGWNNTAYYPSVADLQSSLTIGNSCSSPFTLKVMSYVSILVPFVLGYIFYAWRALDLRKISGEADAPPLHHGALRRADRGRETADARCLHRHRRDRRVPGRDGGRFPHDVRFSGEARTRFPAYLSLLGASRDAGRRPARQGASVGRHAARRRTGGPLRTPARRVLRPGRRHGGYGALRKHAPRRHDVRLHGQLPPGESPLRPFEGQCRLPRETRRDGRNSRFVGGNSGLITIFAGMEI